jgi:predicted permease
MLNDIRYALRMLRQNPGFAFTAIISIALGVGANSAIFSFADALLLRPLPVEKASQVVTVSEVGPRGRFLDVSYPDYVDFRDHNRSFDGLVAFELAPAGFAADEKTQPQLKWGYAASGNFFQVLGVEPRLGRGFRPEENQLPARDAVIVLSHELWQHDFAADPSVIGRHIRLNGTDFSVIGVAPESFTGMDPFVRPAFYIPVMSRPILMPSSNTLTNRNARDYSVKGRLKPGVSLRGAADEIAALAKSLEQSNAETNRGFGATVRTEVQVRTEGYSLDAILTGIQSALAMIVLAIACANVANLMLSRGRARAREIAVRLAIGAGRGRVVRQLMVESLLIALAAGAVGMLIAGFVVDMFSTLEIPGDIPVKLDFQLNERVVFFNFLVSVVSAVLFGLVPALQCTKTDLVSATKAGEADQARKRFFGRSALVTAQIAGSLVLLVAATIMYRGFTYKIDQDRGFRVDHRLTMRIDPTLAGYTLDQTDQIYKTLVERARQVPGVKSAALSFNIPLFSTNINQWNVEPEGYEFPAGQRDVPVFADTVDPNFFQTFGVPIIAGRGFLPSDRADSPPVVIVNAKFAERYLGGNPIGKRVRIADDKGAWAEVVGVTVTGKHLAIWEPPQDFIYRPLAQRPESRMTLIAETYGDPAALAGPLKETVRSINPNLTVFAVRTMEDIFYQRSVKVRNIFIGFIAALGFMGLALALVGLYAVVSYQVSRRTREIGIRMALGAARADVVKMVLHHAAGMSVAGVAIGVVLSLFAVGGIRAAALSTGDPMTPAGGAINPALFITLIFAALPLALIATTLLAAAIPARRASHIDPQQALRQE